MTGAIPSRSRSLPTATDICMLFSSCVRSAGVLGIHRNTSQYQTPKRLNSIDRLASDCVWTRRNGFEHNTFPVSFAHPLQAHHLKST
jgi:hypothetical protein